MKKNPYILLKLAQEIRGQFYDMVNRNVEYDAVIAIKDKYFSQVQDDYNFEGKVFQIGHEKAQEMLNELKELDV